MIPIIIWMYKKTRLEVKIVLVSLAVLILLPAVGVVVLASSATTVVSDTLAAINPVTKLVEIFDPNGHKIGEVALTTNWPTHGVITDEFGSFQSWRKARGLGPHSGVDIANSAGTPVTAFMKGTIVYVDSVNDSSCGKNVKLSHGHNITSLYCHMSSVTNFPVGKEINPGDVIGLMGTTGNSTGNHLHLTVSVYGVNVNPRTFLSGEPSP
jgi:murein DD-endopeptidase MepM/ murein hydrolase activator NlpD